MAPLAPPPTVRATRYVEPLREGGSLPALVEADDDGLYVVKLRGAGQGPKALVAEWLVGALGRAAGLPVPDLAFVELDPALAQAEPDPEIQDLLRGSAGINMGLDFLPGALAFDPAAGEDPDAGLAADVVWLDALVTNVDRTPRNPNILRWHGRLWLIDHGAALYLHHGSADLPAQAGRPFPGIREHVLLPYAGSIEEADARLGPALDRAVLEEVAAMIPESWLEDGGDGPRPEERRGAYVEYLARRLAARGFVREAEAARAAR